MPKGHVMSRAFLNNRPMKDTVIDYTWRLNGREIITCPECKKQGTPRKYGSENVVVHTELASDIRHNQLLEYCSADSAEIQIVLARKERRRLSSLKQWERRHEEAIARKAKKGQSIVEIALLLPFFCLLLFGTMDIGRLVQAQTRVSNAAHLAMRDVQNVENDSTTTVAIKPSDVKAEVESYFPGVTITVLSSDPVKNGEQVTVIASTDFSMITPFVRTMIGQTKITQAGTETTLP